MCSLCIILIFEWKLNYTETFANLIYDENEIFLTLYYHYTTILMITSRFHYFVVTLHIFLVFEGRDIINDRLLLLVKKNYNSIPNQFLSLYSSFYYSVSVILTPWNSDKLFHITLQFLKKWISINLSRSSKWILKLIEVNAHTFSHHYF